MEGVTFEKLCHLGAGRISNCNHLTRGKCHPHQKTLASASRFLRFCSVSITRLKEEGKTISKSVFHNTLFRKGSTNHVDTEPLVFGNYIGNAQFVHSNSNYNYHGII